MPEICQLLDWDSRFFDLRIARVMEASLDGSSIQSALEWCKRQAIDCLYFLADSADQTSIHLAEQTGFNLVDIRTTLSRSLAGSPQPEPSLERISVRPWQPADLPALQAIAASAFRATRFYFDPNFSRATVDSLYQTWITKSCYGYAQDVWVASPADSPSAPPCGFITLHLDSPAASQIPEQDPTGSIGLLGIDPAAQRQGIGRILIESSLPWFTSQGVNRVSVVTQGRNIAAQRLYQRCGFFTQAVQLWYHLWFR